MLVTHAGFLSHTTHYCVSLQLNDSEAVTKIISTVDKIAVALYKIVVFINKQ